MPHPYEDNLRQGYDAFARGDTDTLRSLWTEDIVWHTSGRSPVAGDYKGADAVLGYFGQLFELTGGTLSVELHDVVTSDDHAVALHVTRGQRDGRSVESQEVLVTHWRDGKTSEVWLISRDQYAVDEFWS